MIALLQAALLAVAFIANNGSYIPLIADGIQQYLLEIILLAQAQIPGCARVYTVQPGDFCDKISAAQSASTLV